ncbi:12123_t:CDS:2 [Ambispora leptoticha]|uniref:12123_t:CDS:1 n=1 Tax=Ambispora leptoticha TaxID=144679 RepID=A0A9N9H8H5_9GLOM|nr:12123_t:CDS:2 [Ambispora leptoticha]
MNVFKFTTNSYSSLLSKLIFSDVRDSNLDLYQGSIEETTSLTSGEHKIQKIENNGEDGNELISEQDSWDEKPLPPPIQRSRLGKLHWLGLTLCNTYSLLGSFYLLYYYQTRKFIKSDFEIKAVLTYVLTETIFRVYVSTQIRSWSNGTLKFIQSINIILGRQDYILLNHNLFTMTGDSTVVFYMFVTIIADAFFGAYYCFLVIATIWAHNRADNSFSLFMDTITATSTILIIRIFWRWTFASQDRSACFSHKSKRLNRRLK